jgi:hypothetical protein
VILRNETNLMHYLPSVYSVTILLHVLGLLVAHQQNRPLGRPRHRWKDNIKVDLQEVGCGSMDWIELAQDRDRWRELMKVLINVRVP